MYRVVLSSLEEGGQTALGPALLIAITMACKAAGSKVIMCTDGLANVGLGSLDGLTNEEYKSAAEFYAKLGETAKVNGYMFIFSADSIVLFYCVNVNPPESRSVYHSYRPQSLARSTNLCCTLLKALSMHSSV